MVSAHAPAPSHERVSGSCSYSRASEEVAQSGNGYTCRDGKTWTNSIRRLLTVKTKFKDSNVIPLTLLKRKMESVNQSGSSLRVEITSRTQKGQI